MNDFSIRSNQLKIVKAKYLLRNFFLCFSFCLFVVAFLTLYIVGYFKNYNAIYLIYDNVFLIILIFTILSIGIILFSVFFVKLLKKENHAFHQLYLNALFSECHLEEIYYKFRKKNIDNLYLEDLEAHLNVKKVKYLYCLSDASSSRVLDYLQCTYVKDKEEHHGVILLVKFDELFDGFLQIRTKGEPLIKDYNDKTINRFGFSKRNVLSSYGVFSSLGSITYNLETHEFINIVKEFQNYIKSDFVITYFGSYISIFVESFQFNLTSDYLSFKIEDFERKINSLIRLHKLSNELINCLKSFKV